MQHVNSHTSISSPPQFKWKYLQGTHRGFSFSISTGGCRALGSSLTYSACEKTQEDYLLLKQHVMQNISFLPCDIMYLAHHWRVAQCLCLPKKWIYLPLNFQAANDLQSFRHQSVSERLLYTFCYSKTIILSAWQGRLGVTPGDWWVEPLILQLRLVCFCVFRAAWHKGRWRTALLFHDLIFEATSVPTAVLSPYRLLQKKFHPFHYWSKTLDNLLLKPIVEVGFLCY